MFCNSSENNHVHMHELPLRPGFGGTGTAIKLRTNFFPVLFNSTKPFYEYNIIMHPTGTTGTAIRRVKRRIRY
jgi:hypothetical protein